MIHPLKEKTSKEPLSSTLVSNHFLFKRILSFSTLFKLFFLGALGGVAYFLLTLAKTYEDSIYFPVLAILTICLFFVIWFSTLFLFFSITSTKLERSLLRKMITLLLVMGVLSAYFAVIIENKSFSLVAIFSSLLQGFGVSENIFDYIFLVFYIFIVPVIEEIAKIFPIIILMGNYAKISINENKINTRLTPSNRVIVLFGAFFGGWFDLIEQFLLYSQTSASSSIVNTLLFNRSIYPLHSVTTMITAFGIGWIFNSRKKISKKIKALIFSAFLILSSGMHGLWNYYSIISENPEINIQILSALGYISYGLFAFFLLWIFLKIPKFCPICYTEHDSKECMDISKITGQEEKLLLKKRNQSHLYHESTNLMKCSVCQNPMYNGLFCLNCWSFPKLQCINCNQILPPFSRVCWSCGTEVPTLYEKMTSSSPPFYVNVAVGFTRILGAGMIISFIFAFLTIENTLEFLGNTIFLIAILLSLFITILWYPFRENKVRSMVSSITILSIIAFSLIITSLYMSVFAFLMIISIGQIIYGILGMCFLLLMIIGSGYYLSKVIKGAKLILT